jgi:hypothetical protein
MAGGHDLGWLSRDAVRRLQVVLGALTLFGIVLGVLGPFGSYASSGIALRVMYWVAVMWLGLTFYSIVVIAGLRVVPGQSPWLFWTVISLGALVASVPQALVSRAIAAALWSVPAASLPPFLPWYGQTAIIGLLATGGIALLVRRAAPAPLAAEPPVAEPFPADVIALQMEDHYVRIHTMAGSRLELVTMANAMARLGQVEGMRTHRSWWVARTAVKSVEGTPRNMKLHLTNGLVAPVARSAVGQLRQAGWIADKG